MISGFGTERLGHLSMRFPVFASILCVLVTLFAMSGLPQLGFSGDNVDILRDGSEEFKEYDDLLSKFRDFNNDAIVLVRSDSLNTLEGFEAYRDLHFELQFNPAVESILSPFAMAEFESGKGGWRSLVPARFKDDAELQQFLARMNETTPSFQSLVSPERDSGVMVIYTKAEALEDGNVRATMKSYRDTIAEFRTEDFKIDIAGQPAIRADLVQSIINDMRLLAPMAGLLCAIIALIIFRNIIAVLINVFPSFIVMTWFLGGAGHLGIHLNFLTSVLPILLLVIVFADTLHLYLKWSRNMSEDMDGVAAITDAISTTGPACALAMITTALALISLLFSGNFGLIELGTIGAIGIGLSFIGVIVVLPLTIYWALKLGYVVTKNPADRLGVVAKPAIALLKYRWIIAYVGVGVTAFGIFVHFNLDSRFRLLDYLASSSQVSKSESYIDKRYSGTTPLFAVVKLDPELSLLHLDNQDTFYRAKARVDQVFPSTSSYSLDDFVKEVAKGGGTVDERDLDQLPKYLTSRFISEDRTRLLITIFSPASLTASEMKAKLDRLNHLLKADKLENSVVISGFPILSSVVAPRLMDKLRISLLAAVLLSIAIITIAARSLRLGLACLIPNLLPIVAIEIVLWVFSLPLDMSITVALTVAFGIAVDDSIHLLNQYMIDSEKHETVIAVEHSLREVSPAMLSTSLILIAGLSVTLASELPIITIFSTIVILTLIFAIITDIFQMPSYLATLGRAYRKK